MSLFSLDSMTNHHSSHLLGAISETLHRWHERSQSRRELARWSERDLHDAGLSHSDIAYEIDKPFWRA